MYVEQLKYRSVFPKKITLMLIRFVPNDYYYALKCWNDVNFADCCN